MNTKQYNVLIVEDKFIEAKFIENIITKLGYNLVNNVKNATDALKTVEKNKIDFAFIDINLKGKINGILCADLLNKYNKIAIIYMTEYTDSFIIKEASKTNIYGYLIKPFDFYNIEATLSVAIKRFTDLELIDREKQLNFINLGDNCGYDIKNKTLLVNNNPINLTKTISKTLHILCLNINQNTSYQQLLDYVWQNKHIATSTIRDTILRLRKKVPFLNIQNFIGIGYCLKDYKNKHKIRKI